MSRGLVGVAQTSRARAFEHALLRPCGGFPLDMLIPVSLPAICPGLLLSGFLREFPPNRAHLSPGSSSSVAALVMAGAVWSWHRRTVLAGLCETRFRVLHLNTGRPSSQPRGSTADLSTTGERLFSPPRMHVSQYVPPGPQHLRLLLSGTPRAVKLPRLPTWADMGSTYDPRTPSSVG